MKLSEINPFVRNTTLFPYIWKNKEACIAYDCRLFYVYSGEGSITLNGVYYPLKTHTLILLQPKVEYLICTNLSNPMKIITVNFDYTQNHIDRPTYIKEDKVFNFNPSLITSIITDLKIADPLCIYNMQNLENDLLSLVQEFQLKRAFYHEISSSILKKILASIERMIGANEQDPPEIALQILDFIHANFSSEITNEVIAKNFCYHSYYINKIFKKLTGQSLHQYIMNYRIKIATNLLTTTNLSFKEISDQTGFKSYAHFSSTFKSIKKVSPTEYRLTH